MLQERDSRFFPLAAGWARLCLVVLCLGWLPVAQASRTPSCPPSPEQLNWQTSPLETRVGGPLPAWSVRLFSEGSLKLEIAPTYEELDYEIVSGRRQWPNRDPIGIEGGVNLYAYCVNSPLNLFDPWGEFPVTVSFSEDTAKRYKIRHISQATAVQLMGKQYVDSLDPSYNMFVVDSNALNPYLPSDTRMLTDGEYDLANSIFGTTINYGLVNVIKKKQNPLHPKDTLITPDGNIYANPNGSAYSSDYSSVALKNQDLPTTQELFIHEMTHVYQHQTDVNVVLGSFYRKYDYSYSNLGTLDWNKYGIEQRATIVADYFLVSNGLPKYARNGNQIALPSIDIYRKVLSPYLPIP